MAIEICRRIFAECVSLLLLAGCFSAHGGCKVLSVRRHAGHGILDTYFPQEIPGALEQLLTDLQRLSGYGGHITPTVIPRVGRGIIHKRCLDLFAASCCLVLKAAMVFPVRYSTCPSTTCMKGTNSERLPSELESGAGVDSGTVPGAAASRVHHERECRRRRDHGAGYQAGGQRQKSRCRAVECMSWLKHHPPQSGIVSSVVLTSAGWAGATRTYTR